MHDKDSNLLTVTEAAKKLRIGRTLLYKLMDNGELRYIKIGRTRRIAVDDLTLLVATHRIGGVSHA